MNDLLEGRRLLVIGGSSGIGEATARRAAQAGATVTIASRSRDKLEAALQRLPAGTAAAVLDVTDARRSQPSSSTSRTGTMWSSPAPRPRSARCARCRWRRPGPACRTSSGAPTMSAAARASRRRLADLRLRGVCPAPQPRGGAAGRHQRRGRGPDARAGAGTGAGGRAGHAVSPSTTATPLWDRLGEAGRAARFAEMRERLPVGRIAEPDDIARAILFVATNPFATGSTVLVDGGDALA